MDVESIRKYALALPGVQESFPFDETTLVFKVDNKIFLLLALDEIPLRFNAKCQPDEAIELRENFPQSIIPGYHMNKKHWNTIIVNGNLKPSLIKDLIEKSYKLVQKIK